MFKRGDLRNTCPHCGRGDKKALQFGWMAHVFRYGITPSDVDLVVERNGCFHFQEWKPSLGAFTSSKGQRMTLEGLSGQPNTVCYVVVGEPPDMPYEVYSVPDYKLVARGRNGYLELLSNWFEGADYGCF